MFNAKFAVFVQFDSAPFDKAVTEPTNIMTLLLL